MKNGIDIDRRTFNFGVKIISFINLLPANISGRAIANQLIRSGTSIGANVQEAMGGHTKLEFIHKLNIAKNEARETKYWLELIKETEIIGSDKTEYLLKEIDELVAILTTIIKNSKLKK